MSCWIQAAMQQNTIFRAYLTTILEALSNTFYVGFRVKPEVFGLDTHVLYYTKGFW